MSSTADYIRGVIDRLGRIDPRQIDDAAKLAAAAVRRGGMVQVFGSGHSGLVAMEVAGRASSLAPVNALRDPSLSPTLPDRAGATERLPGYIAVSMQLWDLNENDLVVVVSNSGINSAPIEVARMARDRGLGVIAVTSLSHSLGVASRASDGSRLLDHADVVIDTGSPLGDWSVEVGDAQRAGPVSTVLAISSLHAMLTRTADLLALDGGSVPLITSLNLGGDVNVNDVTMAPYKGRQFYV